MIESQYWASDDDDPWSQHTCSTPARRNAWPEGPTPDELTCVACAWADGYACGYDNG